MKHPPGPPPDLEILEPHLRRLRRDPIDFFRRMARDYGDFTYVRMAGRDVYLLNEASLATRMLACPALAKGYGVGSTDQLHGESEAAAHRRWLSLFTARHLRRPHLLRYAPDIVQLAVRHLREWNDGDEIDALSSMRRLSLEVIGRVLFGGTFDSVRRPAEVYSTRFLAAAGPPLDGLEAPHPTENFPQAEAALDAAVAAATLAPSRHDGLLGALVDLTDGGATISFSHVREIAALLLLAGHETTATLMTWCLLLLARHPSVQTALHEELDAILQRREPCAADLGRLPCMNAIISETLRAYPPGWVLARKATAPCTFEPWTIDAGALVLTCPLMLHHDARYFSNEAHFDPDRWRRPEKSLPRGAYLPFGMGPRRCVGESLAWLEGGLLLATLAARWHVTLAEEGDVGLEPMLSLRPHGAVRLRLHRR